MSIESQRPAQSRATDAPEETSGIIMMLGLLAIFCVLAILFV